QRARSRAMYDGHSPRGYEQPAITERREELAARVARLASAEGIQASAFAPLSLIRGSVQTLCKPAVYEPSLAFVVQGRKRVVLNGEVFRYDPLNYLVVSVTLPAMGQVLEATAARPYLCLRLSLDLKEIARLLLEVGTGAMPPASADRGLYVAR